MEQHTQTLPPPLQATVQLWQAGHDVKSLLSKATYHRHFKALKKHGIDINPRRHRSLTQH